MVLDQVTPLLTKAGFKKRGDGIFTIGLAADVLGWLGLNRATKYRGGGEVEINPVVGVRHERIERLVAELRGEKVHPYQPPTISTALGYVLPEGRYKSWLFTADAAPEAGREMVDAIAEHGVAFMKSMVDLDDLERALEPRSGLGIESQAVYRRPVLWLLSNDAQRATTELDKSLAALGDRDDLAARDFRRYAAALRARLCI